ncbi:hypothetical protein MYU51_018701 [Penicillium brevicompactum]
MTIWIAMPTTLEEPSACQEDMARFTKSSVLGATFEITESSARDQFTNQTVAIKKLVKPFERQNIAKRTLVEVKLWKQLRHENIVNMSDIFISPSEDVYIVTDFMATDLHTPLESKKLEDRFAQFFLYQIMRGLKYIHSAGVIHHDLKPGNILIDENCDLKICDFGLAEAQKTGFDPTSFYRAPEIMLMWQKYNEKIDIWSAGCIFAEMLMGKPLFPGKDYENQFRIIIQFLGNPPENIVANVASQNDLRFIRSLPECRREQMHKLIPGANAKAAALLDRMLQFDPAERISASDALDSQYLALYHDATDEPTATETFDWASIKADLTSDVLKTAIYTEVSNCHTMSNRSKSTPSPL